HVRKIVRMGSGVVVPAVLLTLGYLTNNLVIGVGGAVASEAVFGASLNVGGKRKFAEAELLSIIKTRLNTIGNKEKKDYYTRTLKKRRTETAKDIEKMIDTFVNEGFARCEELRALVVRLEALRLQNFDNDTEARRVLQLLMRDEIIDAVARSRPISPGAKYKLIFPRNNLEHSRKMIEEINQMINDYSLRVSNLSAVGVQD
ncbi:MAG: hypothetical protein AAB612_03705, partial [Patescibacteria group bacterium]